MKINQKRRGGEVVVNEGRRGGKTNINAMARRHREMKWGGVECGKIVWSKGGWGVKWKFQDKRRAK